MHIPKTGGTSAETAILDKLGEHMTVCPIYHAAQYRGKTAADIPGYDFYNGHFQYPFAAGLPADVLKVTLVRPPQDLTLSLFNHIAGRPAHALHAAARAQGLSFPRLIAGEQSLHNTQAKYIIGRAAYREICLKGNRGRQHRVAQVLDLARRHLSQFDLVGTTPRLGSFITRLGVLLETELPAPGHSNRTRVTTLRKRMMTDADWAAMRDATWVDRPLYKMIETEFLPPEIHPPAPAAPDRPDRPSRPSRPDR